VHRQQTDTTQRVHIQYRREKKVQATKFTLPVPHRMKEITNRRPKNGPAVPQYTSSTDSRTKNGKMDKNKCFNLKNSLFFTPLI